MKALCLSLVGLAALLLTSCMVGPNYSTPSVPMPVAYKEAPPALHMGVAEASLCNNREM